MTQRLNIDLNSLLKEYISPHFYETFYTQRPNTVYKGGRSSTKSTVSATRVILEVLTDPRANAYVIQKVQGTIRDSSYAEIMKCIDRMGLTTLFEYRKSPLSIICKNGGNSIKFRGCDDPVKLKGLTTDKNDHYISIVWFEELEQFEEYEAERVLDTFLRTKAPGGLKVLYSYNPPRGKAHWLNTWAEEKELDPNYLVHHSTYLNAKEGFLPYEQIQRIEALKEQDFQYYKWQYLGQIIEAGANIYDSNSFVEIDDLQTLYDQGYQFTRIDLACDSGYGVSDFSLICIGIMSRIPSAYAVNVRMGIAGGITQRFVLLDTINFSPVKSSTVPDSRFYMKLIEQTALELRQKYQCTVNDSIICDSADKSLRNYLHNNSSFYAVSPNKASKVKLIDQVRSFLRQGRFFILKNQNNKLFLQQHLTYQWKEGEDEGQAGEKAKVLKINDHSVDALQYWIDCANREFSVVSNYYEPK